MKKDKEWLKDEVKTLFDKAYHLGKMEYYESEESIQRINSLVDQLDEPEKPVIPKFVADFIEKWKYECLSMRDWFTFDYDNEEDDEVSKWLYDNDYEENTRREYLLIDAVRYGYEVEKEKRYRVVLPFTVWDEDASELNETTMFLALDITSGETRFSRPFPSAGKNGDYRTYLTESQIKAIDERYWAFAEEEIE